MARIPYVAVVRGVVGGIVGCIIGRIIGRIIRNRRIVRAFSQNCGEGGRFLIRANLT